MSLHLGFIWAQLRKPQSTGEQKHLFCSAPTHVSVGDIPGKKHQLHSLHCAVDCQRFALLQDGLGGIHVGVDVLWD